MQRFDGILHLKSKIFIFKLHTAKRHLYNSSDNLVKVNIFDGGEKLQP